MRGEGKDGPGVLRKAWKIFTLEMLGQELAGDDVLLYTGQHNVLGKMFGGSPETYLWNLSALSHELSMVIAPYDIAASFVCTGDDAASKHFFVNHKTETVVFFNVDNQGFPSFRK